VHKTRNKRTALLFLICTKRLNLVIKRSVTRAGIQIGACNFVLLINDVPVAQYFDNVSGTFNTSSPVNDVILKSGKQTFKLILYPGFKNGKPLTSLSENIIAKITIEGLKYQGEGVKTVVSPFTIFELPTQNKTFTEAGKQTAIYEGLLMCMFHMN
jgi:hypothetical protein